MLPFQFDAIKTIAIVGLSDKPERPSYAVGAYLKSKGFTIIPVNPRLAGWNGLASYPDLLSVPSDIRIDVVDIFRKPEEVPAILEAALTRGDVKTIWMQEGVENREEEEKARSKGLTVVSNFCIMKAHQSQL